MIVLTSGGARLRIDEDRGGRLASLQVHGRELLLPAPDGADRFIRWGCFLMAPWVGRIENGVLEWDGSRHQLTPTLGRHAIHGLVFDQAWVVVETTGTEATLTCRFGPPGWPADANVRERLILTDDQLVAYAELVATQPMPASLGWHPWFRRDGTGDARVRLDAAEMLELRDLIPTGRRLPVDAEADLRDCPLLGERRLDHVYPDAPSPALIRWPGLDLEIAWDEPVRAVTVHTTPAAFCVEPLTAWPNAPALAAAGVMGTGLASLPPGGSLAATMRWRWT